MKTQKVSMTPPPTPEAGEDIVAHCMTLAAHYRAFGDIALDRCIYDLARAQVQLTVPARVAQVETKPTTPARKYMTAREAADVLGVPIKRLYGGYSDAPPLVPAHRLGTRSVRFLRADVERAIRREVAHG